MQTRRKNITFPSEYNRLELTILSNNSKARKLLLSFFELSLLNTKIRGSKPYMTNTFLYRLLIVFLGTHLENGDLCIIAVDESASFNSCERICKFSDTR